MLERDAKIYNLMLALRSSRKGSKVKDPVVSIISDIFKRLAMPKAIAEKDFESLMNLTIAKIVDTINAQAITVFFLEQEIIRFKYIYYSPTLYDGGPGLKDSFEKTKQELLKKGIQKGQGVVGKVIQANRLEIVEDTSKDASFLKTVDKFTGFETKSMITLPLRNSQGVAVGAIQVLNKVSRDGSVVHFTSEDVRLLEEVADYSSMIFQKMVDPSFHLSAQDTARYIAKISGCEFISQLSEKDLDPSLVPSLNPEQLSKYGLIPLKKMSQGFLVATSDPMGKLTHDKFERETGLLIEELVVTTQESVESMLNLLKAKKS